VEAQPTTRFVVGENREIDRNAGGSNPSAPMFLPRANHIDAHDSIASFSPTSSARFTSFE
jgi:hypothetical protein